MKGEREQNMPSRIYIQRGFRILAICAAASMFAPTAHAYPPCALPLPSGVTVVMGSGTFGECTGTPAGTLLASASIPFTTSLGTTSGTLLSAVYKEVGGTLDFYYQVSVTATSTDSVSRMTNSNFING